MNHVIEVLSVNVRPNLSGHDLATPFVAKVLLDCGHLYSWEGSAAPAYSARAARGAANALVGTECRCAHPAHKGAAAEYAAPPTRRVMEWMRDPEGKSFWGCVNHAQALFGVTDAEWYADFDPHLQ